MKTPRKKTKKAGTRRPAPIDIEAAPAKQVLLTDVALRDGHQSLLATRMRTEDMLDVADRLDKVGFWSLEVWGGATFDTCLRFLKEDPWERLRAIKRVMPRTRLQMLLRGQNLVGYRHYPDDVVNAFIERAADNGVDVFRIFDALNDIRNMETSVSAVRRVRKHIEATICYTTSPVHSVERFIELAKRLEDLGTDTLCIKDMAGLLAPMDAYRLVKGLKAAVRVPIHLHSHYTSGMASTSALMAILGGLDMLDTALSPLSGGTSHPPTETFVALLRGTPYDTGLDLKTLPPVAEVLRNARKKYHQFESDFAGVDSEILISQIPGGMLSNLAAQLAEQNSLDKFKAVLEEVPHVRQDFGYPPLVTPTSQIVGTQATLNVLTGERYKVVTTETRNYLKGLYGKPPGPVDATIRKRALGKESVITIRPANLLEPELPKATREVADKTTNPEDVLSYALFSSIANDFFDERASGQLKPEPLAPLPPKGPAVAHELKLAPLEFKVTVHGESYHIKVSGSGRKTDGKKPYYIKVNDRLEEVHLEPLVEVLTGTPEAPQVGGEKKTQRPKPSGPGDVAASLPGKVTKVLVKQGQAVKKGDLVLIVEAMKMESQVIAPIAGAVKTLYVKEGDDVTPDETLLVVE
ncbi:MAG TPA: sodium-extruding oxaloacetate decarboxylase subunit alpha [Nitrospirales bacterium]|nr:sodium-extruding oxaloacetate decarboxylase subunit alpha [Nitrospirales bacterium]